MRFDLKSIHTVVAFMLTAAAAAGCGSDKGSGALTGTQDGSGGAGGSAGAGDAGGSTTGSGDCTPGDPAHGCPAGSTCERIVAGGFAVCARLPKEATVCTGSALDECCSTANCTTGKCFRQPAIPTQACNTNVPALDNNVCLVDQCTQDADCGSGAQVCVARGVLGNAVNACVPAACRTDADCVASPGGTCAPVKDPCCNSVAGLFCVYPNHGCRSSADCDAGSYCDPNQVTGVAECLPGGAECLR